MSSAIQQAADVEPVESKYVGAKKFADLLGVKISNLNRVANLPEPDERLEGRRMWLRTKAEKFAADRKARLGL